MVISPKEKGAADRREGTATSQAEGPPRATLRLHAEGRPLELHRKHANNDQNDCHARAESHYQSNAGSKPADGCGKKQQGNGIPARNHAPGKAEANQIAAVDRGRRQLVVVALEISPEGTANPP